jgi:hypothetical protein
MMQPIDVKESRLCYCDLSILSTIPHGWLRFLKLTAPGLARILLILSNGKREGMVARIQLERNLLQL